MSEFRFNPDASIDGTHGLGSVSVIPKRLVEVFGLPMQADRYKVSGRYTFVDGSGLVFTLYDWKETTLYVDDPEDDMSGVPTPEEFWAQETPILLHIGGHESDALDAFRRWLLEQTDELGS